jgi:hypothetical protein
VSETICNRCGDRSNSEPGLTCGRIDDENEGPDAEPCAGVYTKAGPPPVEIMSCPVISTAHLTEDEAQRSPCDWPTHCMESEYGFLVYFGTVADLRNTIEGGGGPDPLDEWRGFLAAAEWAQSHGFEWIRFDQDAEQQPGVPTYEW